MKPLSGRNILLEAAAGSDDPCAWAEENKENVGRLLASEGIVLIRGVGIPGGEQFSGMLTSFFGQGPAHYVYRSTPRTEKHKNIYTASEYHPSETIPQHNENSYSRSWPLHIGFLCRQKAASGGNTPVSDSREAYLQIPREIREEFQRKKVMYVRNYSDVDLPWTEVFQTESPEAVEKFCEEHAIEYEWASTGLRTWQVSQAVMEHPATGESLWFNQAHLFHVSSLGKEMQDDLVDLLGEENLPRNAYFGDGTPIDTEVLDVIRSVYDRTKFSFQWENGDILLLDNMLYTHGREPFTGAREVLVGMGLEYSKK